MTPISIAKDESAVCYIEGSINSCRISFGIKKNEIETLIASMLQRFFALRADKFKIMRREPVDKDRFDFAFLITDDHL